MPNLAKIYLLLFLLTFTSCGFHPKYQQRTSNFDITRLATSGAKPARFYIYDSLKDIKTIPSTPDQDDIILHIEISERWEKGAIQQNSRVERFTYVISTVSTIILQSNQPFQKRHYRTGYYTPSSSAFSNQITERQLVKQLSEQIADDIRAWVYNHQYGVKN